MNKHVSITKEQLMNIVYNHASSTREFSRKTGVPKASLYQWINKGRMPRDVYNRLTRVSAPRVDKNGLIILPKGRQNEYTHKS